MRTAAFTPNCAPILRAGVQLRMYGNSTLPHVRCLQYADWLASFVARLPHAAAHLARPRHARRHLLHPWHASGVGPVQHSLGRPIARGRCTWRTATRACGQGCRQRQTIAVCWRLFSLSCTPQLEHTGQARLQAAMQRLIRGSMLQCATLLNGCPPAKLDGY